MDAGEELIKEIRSGLLRWYEFKEDAAVLCIGCDREKALSYVDGRKVRADYAEYSSITENGMKVGPHDGYDYAVIVEDIEEREDPLEILSAVRGYLKPEGILLLGMNNRYGLRYFCGDRDPYTKRNFDSIENYRRAYAKDEDRFRGRMYDLAQINGMLEKAGFIHRQSYSVMPDLQNPFLLFAHDYVPNEDLANRLFPLYRHPETVFLEEESMYEGLWANGMFHGMANAYLIECTGCGELSDVQHVTASLERGHGRALLTVIRRSGGVEKKAAYPEGLEHLMKLPLYAEDLKNHGIRTVEGRMEGEAYRMPYSGAEVGQVYLKRLLLTDMEKFLKEMDHFRDIILSSSETVREDRHDGEGAVLRKGYLDLVPLNSFHEDGEFMFYDQEFCMEECPANLLLYRMVSSFYASGGAEFAKVITLDELLERYGLMERRQEWQRLEWEFLSELRNDEALSGYRREHCRNAGQVNTNRQRMNYSAEEYEKRFINIFEHADTRKLLLFGSGSFAEHFMKIYGRDYEVYGIIDNSQSRWGAELSGITVQGPGILGQLDSGEYKVIICIKNYLSVMKQLEDMGVGDYSVYDKNRSYQRKLEVKTAAKVEKGEKKKYHIGYVAGAFDMFHAGHLNLLRRAKEQCDYLIAGVISDELIYKLKGRDPVVPLEDRVDIVKSCRYVDQAEGLPEGYEGIREAYSMFHFDVQFSGDDHNDDKKWLEDKAFLERQGADIVFIPYTERVSSTMLREKMTNK